jgi:class 3 adenylate cyclase
MALRARSSRNSGSTGEAARLHEKRLSSAVAKLRTLSLHFTDAGLERKFQEQYFRDNIGYVRTAHVIAIVGWAFFGLFVPPPGNHESYLVITLLAGVGLTSVSLGLTYTRRFGRWWQPSVVALVVVYPALSELYRMLWGHPADWTGVVGLLLVLAFAYTLLRLQYRYAALAGLLAIGCYNVSRILVQTRGDIGLLHPDIYLVAFAIVGTAAAFALERFARLLFLRERDVDRERERGDTLLRNILPEPIIGRLKMRGPGIEDGRIAERYADATVLFADLVGFTERAAHMDPDELIVTLDEVFGQWDQLADRFGLEKIKTIGDAYMAAAGVVEARGDHAKAAAEMAIEIRDDLSLLRWPNGSPMSVRIGIASGPVIAGVIGRRKFAYDIWGDTVNAASRLQSTAPPGTIQVSDAVYRSLRDGYVFSDPYEVDLKGKGATQVHILIGSTLGELAFPAASVNVAKANSAE